MTFNNILILLELFGFVAILGVQGLPQTPSKEPLEVLEAAAGVTSTFCTDDNQCPHGYYCFKTFFKCYECMECCNGEPSDPISKCFEDDGLPMCMSCKLRAVPCTKGGACSFSTTPSVWSQPPNTTAINTPLPTQPNSTHSVSSPFTTLIISETSTKELIYTTASSSEKNEGLTWYIILIISLIISIFAVIILIAFIRYCKSKDPKEEKYLRLDEEKGDDATSEGNTITDGDDGDSSQLTDPGDNSDPLANIEEGSYRPPPQHCLPETPDRQRNHTDSSHSHELPSSNTCGHSESPSNLTGERSQGNPSHDRNLQASGQSAANTGEYNSSASLLRDDGQKNQSPLKDSPSETAAQMNQIHLRDSVKKETITPLLMEHESKGQRVDNAQCSGLLETFLNQSILEQLKIYLDVDRRWALIGEKFELDPATLEYYGCEVRETKSPIEAVLKKILELNPKMKLTPFIQFLCEDLKQYELLHRIDDNNLHADCPVCSQYFETAHAQHPEPSTS